MGYTGAAFFIVIIVISFVIGAKLQTIYKQRGK